MQVINFGRIEGLCLHSGEPVLEPPPRVIKKIRLGADNGLRPEVWRDDFLLKRQICEMFKGLANYGDSVRVNIDIRAGLPFSVDVETTTAMCSGGGR
jgi:hypothetical protein